jgi:hypothetical protein
MTTITAVKFALPLNDVKMLGSLAVFTGTIKETYTLALTVVSVKIELGTLTGIATDRYCAGKMVLHGITEDLTAEFYLSPGAVKFITSLKAERYNTSGVEISIDGEELTLSYLGASFTERMFTGKYPAVQNLFDGLVAGPVTELALKPSFIGKLAKLVGSDGKKLDGAWNFKFHAGPNENRPNPIIASNSAYQVLIQPNLLSR